MIHNAKEHIESYYQKVRGANKELTKKEAFKDLLNRIYAADKTIEKIIDAISAGSEHTVFNIPREDKFHRGSADTLYNKIIIEFENDLRTTLNHAKEQLAGYLLGQFNSGEGYNYTLIVSDFIHWKVFAPDVSQLGSLDVLKEDELCLNEIVSASFTLTESNSEDFFYWIDRFLFREEKQKATLKRIEESFGHQSAVFIESFRELTRHFAEAKRYGEVQVSFEQWSKFLSIAYGAFDATEDNFLIHTYLSIFAKMLAYAVVSNDDYIDEDEMKGIIDGSIFNQYNIQNFIDNDFFHWVGRERSFRGLKKAFRLIAQEISTFTFEQVDEDILKGVYQELIDLDTRHALGEYYTPDWLCERVVNEFEFVAGNKILDPACGSGSFLRAAIHRIKELNPGLSVEDLNNCIYGIDIHPLSVQIAKTTMLLALGKEIVNAKKPVHIHIILANTLLAPEGVKDLFGGGFQMQIDREKLWLNTQVFENVQLFDEALDMCEDLAEQSMHKNKETRQTFENNLKRRYRNGGLNQQVIDSFYQIYESLKTVKEKGRDGIWKFIVQNLYKPYFLSHTFDYVIGNPPWFTFSSVKNEEYQNQLNQLAESQNVKPTRVANFPHLEIAAIFMSYCSSYFLKANGKIAFVVPRSFFSADHHDNTRKGTAKGFRLVEIWDMEGVSPLFRIPSAVLFGQRTDATKALPAVGLPGKSFSGNLPAHNCNLKTASLKLIEKHNRWFCIQRGQSSAFSMHKSKPQHKVNPYKTLFKQGATIVPRAFYFIQLDQEPPNDWADRILNIKTSAEIDTDAKAPWKGLRFKGRMESNFIFRTALSKSILPFALHRPDLVVLPITVERTESGKKEIRLFSADELLHEGYRDAAKWFRNVESIWKIHRTELNRKISSESYLNWHNKLTGQILNSKHIVLYNASAKDANATVVVRSELDLEFVVESVAYVFYTDCLDEAFYLTAILNSQTPNRLMKDFQAKGLFGPRHVHKKILDIYFPSFDERNPVHSELAALSKTAHERAAAFLKSLAEEKKIDDISLGKLRIDLKAHLHSELSAIDRLVNQFIE